MDMDGTIYNPKIRFLEGTMDFLSQIPKKMEDAIFSSPTIPPNSIFAKG